MSFQGPVASFKPFSFDPTSSSTALESSIDRLGGLQITNILQSSNTAIHILIPCLELPLLWSMQYAESAAIFISVSAPFVRQPL